MLTPTSRDPGKLYNRVSIIGVISHPKHGTYHIFYNVETGLYGISKRTDLTHCGYTTLAALFQSKGL